ncbi:PREDICTED: receptor-type tyrosine-protein phosphatase N2-like [Nanorana parkeri]|uniref:receptor-type tyrosine-protein phosphatase N2-like n=1 Tax=Nanorana parkeri TaxID=125878 RepID=UPI0008541657|nr:PREDICTED: receptor-type tyrosine-protein phosphatase N2-like [Nanorana parkeri]
MMGSLYIALLLLLLSAPSSHPAAADTKFGCLFEDDLCKPFEMCLNDGVFGRCQRRSVIDVFKYEVSPPVVQRLRSILQKLSHRGLTWKDDYTQHIIANELSSIRKVYSRPPESLPSDVSSTSRGQKLNAENDRNYETEANRNFAKSFHQYLQYLGILPQSVAPSYYPRTKSEQPPITNSKGKTPGLLFAPTSYQKTPEMVAKTLSKPSADKLQKESEAQGEKKTLLAALKTYLSQKPVSHGPDNPDPNGRAKVSLMYSNKYHTPQLNQYDKVLPKDDEKNTYQIQSYRQRAQARVLTRPSLGAMIYKSSFRQEDPNDPLSAVDETFIQNVVKELGKHKLNIDNLSPKELDELADVIADTLQIVDGEQVGARKLANERGAQELKRVESYETWEHDELNRGVNDTFQGQGTSTKPSQPEIKDRETDLKNENLQDFTGNSLPHEFLKEPFGKGLNNFGDFHYNSDDDDDDDDDEKKAGTENVKSETYTKELTAQKKSAESDSDSKEEIEYQHLVQESFSQGDRTFQGQPKKMRQEIQLQVTSSSNDKYGYIVTQKTPLTVKRGLELLNEVALLLKQQMNVFSDVSVSGSAVVFQVRPNIQNLTTERVANAAGTVSLHFIYYDDHT